MPDSRVGMRGDEDAIATDCQFDISSDKNPPLAAVGVDADSYQDNRFQIRKARTPYRNIDVKNTGQVVKSSAGRLFGWYLSNLASEIRYLKVYNKATAPDETDTPVLTFTLPPSGGGANETFSEGIGGFDNGIAIRGCTGITDSDVGDPGDNEIIVNLLYD